MFGILFFALFVVLWIIYLVSLLFASTFGIIPRLILAIILILIFSFIIKNFWAIAGIIILISLAFWIRSKFIQPRQSKVDDSIFDGDFEEINKNKK